MFWWEQVRDQYLRGQRHQETAEVSLFTPEQIANLRALREHVHTRRAAAELDAAELDIDENHLQFARWLIERGRLSEWTTSAPTRTGRDHQDMNEKYRRR